MQPAALTDNNNFPSYSPSPPRRFNRLLIPLIISLILLVGAMAFAYLGYRRLQFYRYQSDQRVATAVEAAKKQLTIEKDREFAEREKSPYQTYKSPASLASISITYPKNWSAYVNESPRSVTPLDAYFHPGFVPGTQSGLGFALRLQLVNQLYDLELKNFEGKIRSGKVRAAPYRSPQVPDVLGARLEGEVNNGQKVIMVLLPIRDKTLRISTEAPQFAADFDAIIMANLQFSP